MYTLKLCIALFCLIFIQIEATEAEEAKATCPNDSLPCNDGECVRREKWCDGEENCQDKSDEAYCKRKTWYNINPNNCLGAHFKCEIGHCIPLVGRCDGFEDCKDKSDEWNCEPETFDDYDDYILSNLPTVVPTETTTKESISARDEIKNNDYTTTPQSTHLVFTQGAPLPSSTRSFYAKRIEQQTIQTSMPHSTKLFKTTPNALPSTDQDTSQVPIKYTISSKSLPIPSSTSWPQPTRPYQAGFHNSLNHFTSIYHPTSSYFSGHHPIIQQPYNSRQQPYSSGQPSYDSRQQLYNARQPYDFRQHPYNFRQHPYDTRQQPYDTRQQPYYSRQQPFDSIQPPYDSRQPLYDTRQQFYNSRQPYYSRQQIYYSGQQPYDNSEQFQGPRRQRDQYPWMYSIRGHSTVKVREVTERENSTVNEVTSSGTVMPTETADYAAHDSSPVQNGGPLGSKKKKTEMSEAEKRIETALKFFQIFAEKPEKDESSAFCELLCIKLKGMDTDMRQIAMHEINSLIFHLKSARQNAFYGNDAQHLLTINRYFEDQREHSPITY